jgi:hypothetical protein
MQQLWQASFFRSQEVQREATLKDDMKLTSNLATVTTAVEKQTFRI